LKTCLLNLLFLSNSFSIRIVNVVDIGNQEETSTATKLAVLACQGLINRDTSDVVDTVFTLRENWDEQWLVTAMDSDPDLVPDYWSAEPFLNDVCGKYPFNKLLYNKSLHHEIIPQLITLAGVLDAVPLDVESGLDLIPSWQDHQVAFDASEIFTEVQELIATEYVFDNYGNLTTGVAMMNPGWQQRDDAHPFEIALVRDPDVGLADYIIRNKLFNFFLYFGCVPLSEDHQLMSRMMTDPNMQWKKPVEVMGYNNAVHFFGSVFEAETNCISAHNMGQIASSGVNNFSFFTRRSSITSSDELSPYLSGSLLKTREDIAAGNLQYDPATTYMSLFVGDGDNIAFMRGGRRGWMNDRVNYCYNQPGGSCSKPLVFTMSPHLLYLAPDWLHWYYKQANISGPDVFALPPSGHLYAYPGMMDDSMQASFMSSTQKDCELLLARGSVHWEWFYGWSQTFETYFPKYNIPDSCTTSFFATNVPFNFPTDVLWDDSYKTIDNNVFVFKPREWRGNSYGGSPPFAGNNYLSEEEMAAEINNYAPGTVSHLYLTSDGGLKLDMVYRMLDMLDDHVKIVNHEELTEMARLRTQLLNV